MVLTNLYDTTPTRLKLNIGSGYKRLEGFSNIDHDSLTKPDYCFNIENEIWPFENSSVEEVRAHHILEHIGENFFHVIKELYRVCENGAIIDIAVPHPRHDNFFGDPTHRRPITPLMLRQFSNKYCVTHKQIHNSSSGFAPRLQVDFEIIEVRYGIDANYAHMAEENRYQELEELASRFNNVYQDIYIKWMVLKDE